MPSPSPPFTFYHLQMEIKEEATSSQLYFKQTNKLEMQHKKEGKCEEKNLKNILKTFRCQPSESDRSSPLVLFAQDQALETAIHH